MAFKIAINGFGRTGRLMYRAALERHSSLDFVAINRGSTKTLVLLLKYDTVHGKLPFSVEVKGDSIIVDGKGAQDPLRVRPRKAAVEGARRIPHGRVIWQIQGQGGHLRAHTVGREEGPDLGALEGPYDTWVSVNKGEMDGANAIMTRQLQFKGSMSAIIRYSKAFLRLFQVMASPRRILMSTESNENAKINSS